MKEKLKKASNERKVPEKKLKAVTELENLIKNNRTFMVCSIKNLPGKQFEIIKKKLRDKVKIKVVKKNIILRAIDNSGIEIKKMKEHIKEDSALLFSKLELFELSGILSDNTALVNAKTGQIATDDISVEAGATELVPGPAISELSSLGLKIAIEDGKISIKEKKIIVKKNDKINEVACGIMSKLGIKPFKIGFEPVTAYDSEEKKVFTNIKINKEKNLEELKQAFSRSLAFAVKIAYPCKETIRYLLGKAAAEEKALASKIQNQNSQSGGN
ncbi:50S ribosomal protein L10 [Candidatus Pacearchaeota archaeon]|nr:50S ribosomal protein L10 [Candidatus Pacearchaeota archaeon]